MHGIDREKEAILRRNTKFIRDEMYPSDEEQERFADEVFDKISEQEHEQNAIKRRANQYNKVLEKSVARNEKILNKHS